MISWLEQTNSARCAASSVYIYMCVCVCGALNPTKLIRNFCHSIASFFNAFNLHVRIFFLCFRSRSSYFLLLLFVFSTFYNESTTKWGHTQHRRLKIIWANQKTMREAHTKKTQKTNMWWNEKMSTTNIPKWKRNHKWKCCNQMHTHTAHTQTQQEI